MDTQFDDFDDFEDSGSMGYMKIVIAVVAVLAIVAFVMKKRRSSKPERSIDKAMHTIRDSDIPERTRKSVIGALEETRDGITTLRASAEKLAKRAS